MAEDISELKHLLEDWAAIKLPEGRSINELLQIEGHSIWWFCKRLFEIKFIPFQFSLDDIWFNFTHNVPPTAHRLKSKLFRNYILHSEKVKQKLYQNKENISPHKNTVLFLSYLNHLRGSGDNLKYFRIESVLEEIKKQDKLHAEVLVMDEFSHRKKQAEEEIDTIYPFMTAKLKKQAGESAKKIHTTWENISEEHKKNLFIIDGKSIWAHLKPYIKLYFSREMIYTICLYYLTFKEIIKTQGVKATYTSAISSLYEKCLIAASSTCNIPSFMAMHGIGTEFKKNKTTHLHSMNFLVIGQKYKEDLIESGILEKNIFVTGPMIFDELIPYMNTTTQAAQKYILVTTSPFAEDHFLSKAEYFEKIGALCIELKKATELHIIFKLHPREKYPEEYQRIAEKVGLFNMEVLTESTREKHYQLIQQTELLINFGSTTALEGMILNKPTLTINMFKKENIPINTFILNSPATIKVQWDEDISHAITRLLEKPALLEDQAKLFVEQHCYKIDGKTQERVVDVLKNSINHDRTLEQQNHESFDKSGLHPPL
jgi:hypothetical protein